MEAAYLENLKGGDKGILRAGSSPALPCFLHVSRFSDDGAQGFERLTRAELLPVRRNDKQRGSLSLKKMWSLEYLKI